MDDIKVSYFLDLIKLKMEHFKQTREIEFKVNIAAWTLIVATYYTFSNLQIDCKPCCIVLGMLIFAIIHIMWMCLIQQSETKDLESVYYFRTKIEELINFKDDKNEKPSLGIIWLLVECGFTIFLLIIVGILFFAIKSQS